MVLVPGIALQTVLRAVLIFDENTDDDTCMHAFQICPFQQMP